MKKWTIVAFDHPNKSRSVLYRQNMNVEKLLKMVAEAIVEGANLMSIRGIEEDSQ